MSISQRSRRQGGEWLFISGWRPLGVGVTLVVACGFADAATVTTQAKADVGNEVEGTAYAEDAADGRLAIATAQASDGVIQFSASASVNRGGGATATAIVDYRDSFTVLVIRGADNLSGCIGKDSWTSP